MTNVKVEHKEVVVPGQVLAKGMDYLPGDETYRDEEKILSKVLGLANVKGRVIKVTPLSGPYLPTAGDIIIGKVQDIAFSGWRIRTGTAYTAMLSVKDASNRFIPKGEDLSTILAIGDYVVTKITNVTSQNLIDLTLREPGLFKINKGRVITVNPMKVPRLIGKRGSMIGMLKRYTQTSIVVGQNGFVMIAGKPEAELVALEAIRMIEANAHKQGLTEEVEAFLKEKGLKAPAESSEQSQEKATKFGDERAKSREQSSKLEASKE